MCLQMSEFLAQVKCSNVRLGFRGMYAMKRIRTIREHVSQLNRFPQDFQLWAWTQRAIACVSGAPWETLNPNPKTQHSRGGWKKGPFSLSTLELYVFNNNYVEP